MAGQLKPIKLVKKSQSGVSEPVAEIVVVENRHGWSQTIQRWIKESRQQTRQQSMIAFENLFKD
jgi:hypothetical protein